MNVTLKTIGIFHCMQGKDESSALKIVNTGMVLIYLEKEIDNFLSILNEIGKAYESFKGEVIK